MFQEAKFHTAENGNIRCRLCSHRCLIAPERTGLCNVRYNDKGKLVSLAYGRPAVQNADPIEKKPLFHFLPGSQSHSIGTYGCNLRCENCQNFDLSQALDIAKIQADEFTVDPDAVVEAALMNECQSISYTYNEPTVFAEYALDIMRLAHLEGLKNVWVTNAFMSGECLEALIPHLDAANADLKSFDPKFYRDHCGARLEPVLKNLVRLKNESVHLEITTLIIPGLSGDWDMIKEMADWLVTELGPDTPWHISRFSPQISWKLKQNEATGEDLVYGACDIGKQAGLKYVYAGNLPGDPRENTYCPSCGEICIQRMGYDVERMDINGNCPSCDASLDIID